VRKGIADIEVAMHRSAGILIIDTITFAPGTIVTTAIPMLWLLKLKVSQEEEEGGLRT
jgi:hypothetical protein